MSKIPKVALSKSKIPAEDKSKSQHLSSTGSVKSSINMQTRGEKLYDFLKSMGYQPSKHLKPEHLEYLFHDEKTSNLLRRFAKKARSDQGLTPEEIESFDSLQSDGIALYGTDLEEAVDRKQLFEKRLVNAKDINVAKKEELRKLIAKRKGEVEEIKRKDEVIRSMITEVQTSKSVGQKMAHVHRESQELGIAIHVTEKRLQDKIKAVTDTRNYLREDDNFFKGPMKNAQDVVALKWRDILQLEDNLTKDIKALIEKHVAHLIIQAEGYEEEYSESKSEMLHQVLSEYVENFERLKHCIIYERVRRVELEVELAGEEGIVRKLQPCHEQILRMNGSSRDVYAKMHQEVDNSICKLQETFEKEFAAATEAVRDDTRDQLNLQFESLMNLKAPAKKRLRSFFCRLYSILEPQKVRVDILRNILKEGVNYFHDVVEHLEEFSLRLQALNVDSQMFAADFKENNLTREGLALLPLLTQHDIPVSVLQSFYGTSVALGKILNKTKQSDWNCSQKEIEDYKECFKILANRHQDLWEVYRSLNTKHFKKDEENRLLQELEKTQLELNNSLYLKHENKCSIVTDSIAEKEMLLQKMKDVLANN